MSDIPPAPRGVPQIEVTFDIDANGILNVSAKDKATGKEQSIVIRASSGLGDDEIERMVADAEAHAEEDRKFHELVDARNAADALIHSTEQSIEQLVEKTSPEDLQPVRDAVERLKKTVGSDNQADIERDTQTLRQASDALAEKVYAQDSAGGSPGPVDDDVLDADFEDVTKH